MPDESGSFDALPLPETGPKGLSGTSVPGSF